MCYLEGLAAPNMSSTDLSILANQSRVLRGCGQLQHCRLHVSFQGRPLCIVALDILREIKVTYSPAAGRVIACWSAVESVKPSSRVSAERLDIVWAHGIKTTCKRSTIRLRPFFNQLRRTITSLTVYNRQLQILSQLSLSLTATRYLLNNTVMKAYGSS
jgi:hypothetical protein